MRKVVVVGCALALAASLPSVGTAREEVAAPPRVNTTLAAAILAKINEVRAGNNLAPLVVNTKLTLAARQHSKEMLVRGFFNHDSYDGSSFLKRVRKWYRRGVVGENILWHVPDVTAAQALQSWMSSPGHRAVILDRSWRSIGIGALHSASAPGMYQNHPVTVVTTDFGSRR